MELCQMKKLCAEISTIQEKVQQANYITGNYNYWQMQLISFRKLTGFSILANKLLKFEDTNQFIQKN
jgi:hypothetical protein